MKLTWDIFCKVVDNFGDIGVTWRLARQLVAEHGLQVRLWIDDLSAFVRICPEAEPRALQQLQRGVDVRQWPAHWEGVEPADILIEGFGCKLPDEYVAALEGRSRPALWINLDYLSAETWVGGCHGLASFKTASYRKFFFFPGFRPDTGGLLREASLIPERDAFQQEPARRVAFLRKLGVAVAPDAQLISLFAYENASLAGWLDVLAEDETTTHLVVPEGRVLGDIQQWLGAPALAAGTTHCRGRLTIQVLPFMHQDDYDRLLWACDFNAVRGEDSFVRAQWAGRPLLWHIYKQEEYVHWEKLEAFLELYTQALGPEATQAVLALWRAWNMDGDMAGAWRALQPYREQWRLHARQWCAEQVARPDLATALVQFCRNSL